MTTIKIQETLKKEFEEKVLKNLNLFNDSRIKVFVQDLPMSKDFEFEGLPDAEKYFPCVIIKAIGGEISKCGMPQTMKIDIFVVCKDWQEDMSGYKNVLIVMERIRDYLISEGGIHGKARLQYPLTLQMVEDDFPLPYFEGAVSTTWTVETMAYNDYEQLL